MMAYWECIALELGLRYPLDLVHTNEASSLSFEYRERQVISL